MMNIQISAPAAFAPGFAMPTEVCLAADARTERTRGHFAAAAKRTQGTPVWRPPTV